MMLNSLLIVTQSYQLACLDQLLVIIAILVALFDYFSLESNSLTLEQSFLIGLYLMRYCGVANASYKLIFKFIDN